MAYFAHGSAFNLPDLDTLDPAALKATIFAQQDHYQAQQERYTRTLTWFWRFFL